MISPTFERYRTFWLMTGVLVVSRIFLTTLGSLVRLKAFPFTESWSFPGALSSHVWLNVWGLWDTGWYYRLATEWYSSSQSLGLAFFPLYPGIVRAIGFVTGHHFLVGLIVANISLAVSCWLLYRITKRQADEGRARWAVWFLLASPAAFVLSGMFTEALYLAIALACFVAGYSGRWWLAGLLGLALALTRVTGVFIIIPLLIIYLSHHAWHWKKFRPNVLWLLLIPVGMIIWLWYNQHVTGDALAFIHVQSVWRRAVSDPISSLWRGLWADNFYDQALSLLVMITAGTLVALRRYIDLPMKVWAWLSLTLPLFSGIYSMPRYTLVMFPLYVGLAKSGMRTPWRLAIIIGLSIIQLGLFVYWPKPNSWVV